MRIRDKDQNIQGDKLFSLWYVYIIILLKKIRDMDQNNQADVSFSVSYYALCYDLLKEDLW